LFSLLRTTHIYSLSLHDALPILVEVGEEHILEGADLLQPLFEDSLVEELVELNADLGIFIRVEGGDAGTGGAEGTACQALLLVRSEEHTSELQSRFDLVCRLLLE